MKLNPKLRKGLTAAAYILVAAFAVFIAFILYSNMTGKTVFIAGKTAMWVKTGSMEPQIPTRSYILVEKPDIDKIKVGDVIVFKSDDPEIYGSLNAHRVVEVLPGGKEFVTRGDNNPSIDKYSAKAANVIGVYRKNLKVLSFFGRFFLTPLGITVTVIVLLAMIVPAFLPDILAAVRGKKGKSPEDEKKEKFDELVKAEVERLRLENNNGKSDTDIKE